MGVRADRAAEYFKSGYNCSQSVLLAFADIYGIDEKLAKRLSYSFGGGMGRLREVCGAFSGMLMVNGMATGSDDVNDREAKKENYAMVQHLAECFKAANGSIYCRELLGLGSDKSISSEPVPEARTEAYYGKRPCEDIVREAAKILERELYKNSQDTVF